MGPESVVSKSGYDVTGGSRHAQQQRQRRQDREEMTGNVAHGSTSYRAGIRRPAFGAAIGRGAEVDANAEVRMQNAECRTKREHLTLFCILHSQFCISRAVP